MMTQSHHEYLSLLKKQLSATVASFMHEGEKVVSQSGGIYVGKENTVRRLRGDGGASARSGHPR